jgi:phosphoenolpyruvate carboxykinase (ATP)
MYDLAAYQRFSEELPHVLKGPNIQAVDMNWLEPRAKATGIRTQYGSYGWRSAISSRIAPKTVYLGGEAVCLPETTPQQAALIGKAPEELEKVLHLLRTLPFYHIRRQMGENDYYNPVCNLYVSAADVANYRLGYMWGTTLFKPSRRPGPEFTMIHIPEEHPLRQQVLVMPEHNINIALGTDYMGEDKKGPRGDAGPARRDQDCHRARKRRQAQDLRGFPFRTVRHRQIHLVLPPAGLGP